MRLHGLVLLGLWACAAPLANHQVRDDPQVETDPALRRAALREVNRLAGLMGYERYLIVLRWDTLQGDVIARLVPRPDVRGVIIPLDARYFAEYREDLCPALVHELEHGKLYPLRQFILSLIHPADSVTMRRYAMLEESIVSDRSRLPVWRCP